MSKADESHTLKLPLAEPGYRSYGVIRHHFDIDITTRVPRLNADGREIGGKDGPVERRRFELVINLAQLRKELGRLAAKSKRGRTQALRGLVRVTQLCVLGGGRAG